MSKIAHLIILILLCISINAQNISLGGKIGLNITSVYGQYLTDYKFKNGLVFGLVSQLKIANSFSIQPELNYEQKGTIHKDGTHHGWVEESIYKFNYLELPVLAKYYFGNKKMFFINAGPYVGYLLKAIDKYIVTDANSGKLLLEDFWETTENYKKFEFGFSVGMGPELKISDKLKLLFDARYNFSLTSVNKVKAEWYPKNHGFNFNLGMLISL